MKKLLFSIAAAAAMLVSCSEKEITVPETGSGEPFSFHASILADKAQDTKTTLTIEGTAEKKCEESWRYQGIERLLSV